MVIADKKDLKEDDSNKNVDPEIGKMETSLVEVSKSQLQAEKKPLWGNLGMLAAMYVFCVWGLHSMAYSEVSIMILYFSALNIHFLMLQSCSINAGVLLMGCKPRGLRWVRIYNKSSG